MFVYRFKVGGTFEDAIHNKTLFKTQLSFRVVDKKDTLRATKRQSLMEWFSDPTECEEGDLLPFKGKDPLVLDKLLERYFFFFFSFFLLPFFSLLFYAQFSAWITR